MTFRRPTNPAAGVLLPFVDPSPTVTMYGGESQIIKPEKREHPIKAMINPLSAVMTLVILTALVLIPLTELPPDKAIGQQRAAEASFPMGPPVLAERQSNLNEIGRTPQATPARVSDSQHQQQPALVDADVIDDTTSTPQNPALNFTEQFAEHFADQHTAPDDDPPVDVKNQMMFDGALTADSDFLAATSDQLAEDSAALPVYLPTPPLEDSFELVQEIDETADEVQLDTSAVDLALLEDQLEIQSAIIEAGTYDTRVPQSIATLSTLKNRTQLVRALASYQAQKVLLFGSKTNVKEPDLAFIFLINKDNKRVRGLLAPSPEGWTDIYTGKIVTEEKGRFYEREPNSEVTLKWWLHDVTPIWVELKKKQKMVARPVPAKSKKKRLGW